VELISVVCFCQNIEALVYNVKSLQVMEQEDLTQPQLYELVDFKPIQIHLDSSKRSGRQTLTIQAGGSWRRLEL
jgi:hypothetical protein